MNVQPSIFELMSSLRDPNSVENLLTENEVLELNTDQTNHDSNCSLSNNDDDIENEVDIDMPVDATENSDSNLSQNSFDFEDLSEDPSHFEQKNIDNEDLRKLHTNTSCTVIDALVMIYAFAIRHNLTWEATEDLVRLSNRIIGKEELPPSKYVFKKKMNQIKNYTSNAHFFCHKCNLYFGTIQNINRLNDRICPNCHVEIQTDTKFKKNHFIVMPIKNQLRDVLERNNDYLNLNFDTPAADISDVHDSFYFQHLKGHIGNVPIITITFSTDGAAIFKSTKEKSVWPLQFIVNEINLERRFKRENMLCSAISFGKTPNMQIFFKPFLDEINKINAEGGLNFALKNGRTQTVKIFPMIFTGDTPARADVLMKSQFNGYKGCTHCLHGGTLVNKQIRYCRRDSGPLRTNEGVRSDMLEAQIVNGKINGYKGLSPLIALDYFDVVWQVGIDKMHNIDLGITAKMFKLFLESGKNRKE